MPHARSPALVAREARSGAVSRLAGWMRGRLDRWSRNRRLLRELARLDDHERACVLSDFGLTEQEFLVIAGGPELPMDLWRKVMVRLGLDPERIPEAPEVLRQLSRTCTTCSERRRCQRLLSARHSRDDHRAFCPNAAVFDAMLRRAPRSVPPAA